jgi:hypothetical protein
VVGIGSAASASKMIANQVAGQQAYANALEREFKSGDADLARQGIVNLTQSGWSEASSSNGENPYTRSFMPSFQ